MHPGLRNWQKRESSSYWRQLYILMLQAPFLNIVEHSCQNWRPLLLESAGAALADRYRKHFDENLLVSTVSGCWLGRGCPVASFMTKIRNSFILGIFADCCCWGWPGLAAGGGGPLLTETTGVPLYRPLHLHCIILLYSKWHFHCIYCCMLYVWTCAFNSFKKVLLLIPWENIKLWLELELLWRYVWCKDRLWVRGWWWQCLPLLERGGS